MRLIDADALERMGYLLTRTYQQDKETMVYETKKLSDVPTAQQQQKKGHWINDCTCSVCHWIHEDYEGFALITNYNYCPRCGARMDGENDED